MEDGFIAGSVRTEDIREDDTMDGFPTQEYTVRVNPEIDAKLDRFIKENPAVSAIPSVVAQRAKSEVLSPPKGRRRNLHGYYNGLSKEQLIRHVRHSLGDGWGGGGRSSTRPKPRP